ncbi:hypothetical protein CH63R_02026 [Colletotrichum higginsianum IMI 349063]|uniref:Uncharacterized protein n=1 Tax=Colletotrichum higginsianum (strain IMI 349063) TaxID=759273 RepID=A0A1B7YMM8_COLHI|nr:hypothetical protein CH63R_02026 [Colletotrichum higginsianum IMI 349063]OBR13300.1 hypothetical protein CH63R_02026 [Colletotrichum higginsianum IMI 349063]
MTEHVVCDNLMRSIEDTCNEITNEMPDTDNTDTTDVSPTVNIDVEMNEESRSLEDATVVYNKPTERIFFFKRMKSEHPRLDVLFQDKQDFLFDAKWVARVKVLAKLLRINLRTPFDGHSKPTSDGNVGNWRAGHIEKKLSTHMVYTLLAMYQKKKGKVTLKDLRHLRQILREEGFKPEFEIHLSRGPCGTPHRLGLCVPFVRRLSQITGVKFTIHS